MNDEVCQISRLEMWLTSEEIVSKYGVIMMFWADDSPLNIIINKNNIKFNI